MRAAALALCAVLALSGSAHAAPPMETVQPVDSGGVPLGTDANPFVMRAPAGQSAVLGALSSDQAATINGRGWSVSTGPVTVPANQQLDSVLVNPAGSGCTAVFVLRRLTNPSGTNLSYTSYTNPTAITASTSTVGNRLVGSTPNTGMSFGYAARASGSMGGTAGVSSPLLANQKEEIIVPTVLRPGYSYGIAVAGLSGALAGSVTLGLTFAGFCL